MGFATSEEIVRFIADLEAASAARRADMLRQMLPKIRDDVLYAELKARLEALEATQ